MNTRMIDEYIKRLKRRRDYLDKTTEDKDHYAKSELAALEWAIAYIQDTTIAATEHQIKYYKSKKENNEIHIISNDSYNTVREPATEH